MFIDLAVGTIVYVVVSVLFARPFDWLMLGVSVVFTFLPDADFIPYVILRKKLRLVSHHFIHFPLVLIPGGTILVWEIADSAYVAVLFSAGVFLHLTHDSFGSTGIKWLWPLSSKAYTFMNGRIEYAYERERIFEEYMAGIDKRSMWDEVRIRLEGVGFKIAILLLVALLLVILHAVLS